MSAPIDPRSLAGLKLYVRADRGVTVESGKVATWADQSGNGNDLVQSSDGHRPGYQSDAGDGLPAVSFDAGNGEQFEAVLDLIESAGHGYTVILTARPEPGTFGVAVSIGGGLDGGGGSDNTNIQFDTTPGNFRAFADVFTDDGGIDLLVDRNGGVADFATYFLRQSYNFTPQNFLTYSEDFSQGAWSKVAGAVVTPNVMAGPFGGASTADVIAGPAACYVQQNCTPGAVANGQVYDASVWVRADRRLPAVKLAADSHYVDIPYDASLKVGSGSFVIAVWFWPTSLPAGSHVVFQYGDTYSGGVLFNANGGAFAAYVDEAGPTVNAAAALTVGRWHRLVVVGDAVAQTVKAYVNGVQVGSTATSKTWDVTPNERARIGASVDLAVSARGYFRDLVICKASEPGFAVPDPTAITADFNRTASFGGISARYPLNEGTGTTAAPSTGVTSGTLTGGAAWQTGQGFNLIVGDSADGVPSYTANLSCDASWLRFNISYVATAASSSSIALIIQCADENELVVWGAQISHSYYPIDYTPTGATPIGTDALNGTGEVSIRGGIDATDVSDSRPAGPAQFTGNDLVVGARMGWNGSELTFQDYYTGKIRQLLIYDRDLTVPEWQGVYAWLLSNKETTPPVVSNLTPAPGTTILSTQAVSLDVTDDSGAFRRVIVTASFPSGASEVVHDGDGFAGYYAGSSRTLIAGGLRYTITRLGGWPGAPTIKVIAIDPTGTEI